MRIAVITPWFPVPEIPYAGVFVAQQAEALSQHGHEVTVVHLDAQPFSGPRSAVEGDCRLLLTSSKAIDYRVPNFGPTIEYCRIPFLAPSSGGFFSRAEAARLQLSSVFNAGWFTERFDVLHSHVTMPGGYAAIEREVPVVNTEHFTGIARVLAQSDARTAFARVASRAQMVCVSSFLLSHINDHLTVPLNDIEVVPNLVDFAGLDYRQRTEIGNRWIYVGSLNHRKNVDRLLNVFHLFKRNLGDAHLRIVGTGELRAGLEDLARQLEIDKQVDFLGALNRNETAAEIGDSDLMVHLSQIETFGLTAVEAIAAGVPVISLSNGGAAEAWGEIESFAGRILAADSTDAEIADDIIHLCSAPHTLDLKFASDWVRERYSPENVVSQLSSIYSRIT